VLVKDEDDPNGEAVPCFGVVVGAVMERLTVRFDADEACDNDAVYILDVGGKADGRHHCRKGEDAGTWNWDVSALPAPSGDVPSKSKKGKRAAAAEEDEAPAKKQKKDPNLPKKARSAFVFFSIDERKSPDVSALSFGEQGKAISLSWKAISAADRKPYDEMNAEDVARYARDVEAYEAEHGPLPKPARKQKEPKEPDADERGGGTSKGDASKGDASKSKVARKSKGVASSLASIVDEDEENNGGDAVAAFGVGDQLAWIPQAYEEFAQAYGTTLRKLSLPQLPHALEGSLMGAPADGTANAAEVVGVSEPTEFAPGVAGLDGWRLLRLKQVAMPGAPEGRGVDGAAPAEYNLPVLRRALCDVDQHTCELARYVDSRRWRADAAVAQDAAKAKRKKRQVRKTESKASLQARADSYAPEANAAATPTPAAAAAHSGRVGKRAARAPHSDDAAAVRPAAASAAKRQRPQPAQKPEAQQPAKKSEAQQSQQSQQRTRGRR